VPEGLIVDASAMVDLLLGTRRARAIQGRLRGNELHVPAHFDAEVFSAIGRLERGGHLKPTDAQERIQRLSAAPLERHRLAPLLSGAWQRRHNLRLVDTLYVELADRIGAPIITVDAGLAAVASMAERID
jgi:predicted nucleic acid-binding protein